MKTSSTAAMRDELRPGIGEADLGLERREDRDDAADEDRDRRVEHGGDRADDEERDQQAFDLPDVMPVERGDTLRRRRARAAARSAAANSRRSVNTDIALF